MDTPRNEDVDVSKNTGTPKWMVKIMENPIKMDDLEVPLFLETPMYFRTWTWGFLTASYVIVYQRVHQLPTDFVELLLF